VSVDELWLGDPLLELLTDEFSNLGNLRFGDKRIVVELFITNPELYIVLFNILGNVNPVT